MKKRKRLHILLIFSILALGFETVPTYTIPELIGNFEPEKHPEFRAVPTNLSTQATHLRSETIAAFQAMADAAQRDGITLKIVSGTRNRARQIEIWSDKWAQTEGSDLEKASEILHYSSMPGTSRHHWGTDIDINTVEPEYFDTVTGERVYAWLAANAVRFGFFQPFVAKGADRKAGYHEEKWHWSYYPIADQMLRAYRRLIDYEYITGFPGAELAPEIGVIDDFVNGIAHSYFVGEQFNPSQDLPNE